ncbi:hypothetical protein BESB_058590 [Besnoitia besnoiti]|uniref:Tr-type G domain-containing protein n=1 Tax=Besnoitia besnoiti TaxID=94643 RepID=A0A2A9MHU7_BESBE|nr:hypothetical protein BESB_058590 [Besnoitia besnoiti]PFH34972.1 hypothetical protein BESB_058590 [Besnoitia besnoiti]
MLREGNKRPRGGLRLSPRALLAFGSLLALSASIHIIQPGPAPSGLYLTASSLSLPAPRLCSAVSSLSYASPFLSSSALLAPLLHAGCSPSSPPCRAPCWISVEYSFTAGASRARPRATPSVLSCSPLLPALSSAPCSVAFLTLTRLPVFRSGRCAVEVSGASPARSDSHARAALPHSSTAPSLSACRPLAVPRALSSFSGGSSSSRLGLSHLRFLPSPRGAREREAQTQQNPLRSQRRLGETGEGLDEAIDTGSAVLHRAGSLRESGKTGLSSDSSETQRGRASGPRGRGTPAAVSGHQGASPRAAAVESGSSSPAPSLRPRPCPSASQHRAERADAAARLSYARKADAGLQRRRQPRRAGGGQQTPVQGQGGEESPQGSPPRQGPSPLPHTARASRHAHPQQARAASPGVPAFPHKPRDFGDRGSKAETHESAGEERDHRRRDGDGGRTREEKPLLSGGAWFRRGSQKPTYRSAEKGGRSHGEGSSATKTMKRGEPSSDPPEPLEVGAVFEAVVTNIASHQRAFLRVLRRVSQPSEVKGGEEGLVSDEALQAEKGTVDRKSSSLSSARTTGELNVPVTAHIARMSHRLRDGVEGGRWSRSPAMGGILTVGASVLITPLPVGSEAAYASHHVSGALLQEVAILADPQEAATAAANAPALDGRLRSPFSSPSPSSPSPGPSARRPRDGRGRESGDGEQTAHARGNRGAGAEPRAFGFDEKYWPAASPSSSHATDPESGRSLAGRRQEDAESVAPRARVGSESAEELEGGARERPRRDSARPPKGSLPVALVGQEVGARAVRVEEGYAILKLFCLAPQAAAGDAACEHEGDADRDRAPAHAGAAETPWGFLHWASVRFRDDESASDEGRGGGGGESRPRASVKKPNRRVDLRQLMAAGDLVRVGLKAPPTEASPRWQLFFDYALPPSASALPTSDEALASPSGCASPSGGTAAAQAGAGEGRLLGMRPKKSGDEEESDFIDALGADEDRQPGSPSLFFLEDETSPGDAALALASRSRRRRAVALHQGAKEREEDEDDKLFFKRERHRGTRRALAARDEEPFASALFEVDSVRHARSAADAGDEGADGGRGPRPSAASGDEAAASDPASPSPAGAPEGEEEAEEDEELWLLREEAKLLAQLRESGGAAKTPEEAEQDAFLRPAIVCVLGHIDHGKTTLLRALKLKALLRAQARREKTCQQEEESEAAVGGRRRVAGRTVADPDGRTFEREQKAIFAAAEAGGITQRLSAFQLAYGAPASSTPSAASPASSPPSSVTFLDTPGHAAFEQMRARATSSADLAVLVVAADEGVQEQTIRSIQMCRAANIPFVVALTKRMRLPLTASSPVSPSAPSFAALAASPPVVRVLAQLAEHGVLTEPLGGDVQVGLVDAKAFLDRFEGRRKKRGGKRERGAARDAVKAAAASGQDAEERERAEDSERAEERADDEHEDEEEEEDQGGGEAGAEDDLDDLIDKIFLQAEMLELRTSLSCPGEGVVMESFVAKGIGGCASVLLKRGSVKKGAVVLAGPSVCRIRQLRLHRSGMEDEAPGESSRKGKDPRKAKKDDAEEVVQGFAGEALDVCGFPAENLPLPGETFVVIKNEAHGRQLAELNKRKRRRAEESRRAKEAKMRLLDRLLHGEDEDLVLPVVIKADQQGTAEALASALTGLWAPPPTPATRTPTGAVPLEGPVAPPDPASLEQSFADEGASQWRSDAPDGAAAGHDSAGASQKGTVFSGAGVAGEPNGPGSVEQTIRDTWTRRMEYEEGIIRRRRNGETEETRGDTAEPGVAPSLSSAGAASGSQANNGDGRSPLDTAPFSSPWVASFGRPPHQVAGVQSEESGAASSASAFAASAAFSPLAAPGDTLRAGASLQTGNLNEARGTLEGRGSGRTRTVKILAARAGLVSIEDVRTAAVSRGKAKRSDTEGKKGQQREGGVVVAFSTTVDRQAKEEAARQGVTLVTADVVYDAVSQIEAILRRQNLFSPDKKEEAEDTQHAGKSQMPRTASGAAAAAAQTAGRTGKKAKPTEETEAADRSLLKKAIRQSPPAGKAIVKALFHLKSGLVVGCGVAEGAVNLGATVQVVRDGQLIHEGSLVSLRVGPEAQTTVRGPGTECGVMISGDFTGVEVGDHLLFFPAEESQKRKK